ncbi:hypothetical protein JW823_04315 [bacterium]|nr:hypothetical protein [candidate division CSSED10-310 bacterium]
MNEFNRNCKTHSLVLICAAIGLLAFGLRIVHCGTINNNIDDLSARQAIMCLDILNGCIHFPNGPWILEYDESGYAWLMVPWIFLFGKKWSMFRLFSTLLASVIPPALAWIATRKVGFKTGLAAGLLMATIPAQLVWDRHPIMGAITAINLLWLIALHIVSNGSGRSAMTVMISGSLIAGSCYIAHYSLIILPAAVLTIMAGQQRIRLRVLHVILLIAIVSIGISPLLINHLNHPEYALWRERHFHGAQFEFPGLLFHYRTAFISHLNGLFPGGREGLFLRKNIPVITFPVMLLILAGIAFLLRSHHRSIGLILGLPVFLYLLMGFISVESWSGMYHAHAMPFLILLAALGLSGLSTLLARTLSPPWVNSLYLSLLIVLAGSNVRQFFNGKYSIHPRPDKLTRLQMDMEKMQHIPYIFSKQVDEVAHFHLPFWFATRSYQERISIVDWRNGEWRTDPDRQPVVFETSDTETVGFVIPKDYLAEFSRQIEADRIVGQEILPVSGLLLVHCRVEVPILLRRTWTTTMVPPLLQIVHD